ncbi:5-demethoxyubiquinol-8 5-hydroxylase UbiM [Cardiobacteriales bacterium ML27]|uniref:5-demethoxyubiquinol-8 5-hydroxylase UbiM n=1 Tax=Ostreibacterium oceani TaxID=2654998 RepID=A0A6N7EXB9_9GAMM|nr:5-demethoxyubiquinol-8 5-hydroxylase UbiM [Ostreibacterium oceani]
MADIADIVVIGAGPAGLSFCKSLADSGLSITLVEQHDQETLANPPPDGREIALTHVSQQTLQALGAWDYLPAADKYYLRQAKVIDGDSPYTLHFPTPDKALGQATDTLGYLISNHNIRRALYAQCKNQPNLTFKTATRVHSVTSNREMATVTLANGDTVRARLVVAADSRFSASRRQMGISTQMQDFGRTVVVFRMQHTLSNESTATECFYYGQTLAILPLTEKLSSIVITIDSASAHEILDVSPDALRRLVIKQLDAKLGDMHLIGERHSYPLVGVHANRFYSQRYALIGDAAVGMHPVTAHGFNLGLQSQSLLAELILAANRDGKDIANPELLREYDRKHRRHTLPLYLATNVIVKLFTTETPPAKIVRKFAIRAGNVLLPFKKIVSKQLTG